MNKKSTPLDLKAFLEDGGIFCMSLRDGDYISMGVSIFIGVKRMPTGQTQLRICTPERMEITHYKYNRRELPDQSLKEGIQKDPEEVLADNKTRSVSHGLGSK